MAALPCGAHPPRSRDAAKRILNPKNKILGLVGIGRLCKVVNYQHFLWISLADYISTALKHKIN
jgi:hypothetical protein